MKVERSTYGLRVTGLGDRHPKGLTLPARQGERLVRLLLVDYRSVSADRHPLALFHYRLLERPFVRDLILRDNMFPKKRVVRPSVRKPRQTRSGDRAAQDTVPVPITRPTSIPKCITSGGDRFSGCMILRIGQEAATVPLTKRRGLSCPRAIAT